MNYMSLKSEIVTLLALILYLIIGVKLLVQIKDNIDSILYKKCIKNRIKKSYSKLYVYLNYSLIVVFWPIFIIIYCIVLNYE